MDAKRKQPEFKQIFTWLFQRVNENTDAFGKKKRFQNNQDPKCLLQKRAVHQIPPFSLDKMQHPHML